MSDVHFFIDDFLAAFGLRCCVWLPVVAAWAVCPCGGARASRCCEQLLLGSAWVPLVAAHRLGGCRSRALGHQPGVAMLQFSFSAAGRIFPGQGLNLSVFPALAGGTAKEVQMSIFLI